MRSKKQVLKSIYHVDGVKIKNTLYSNLDKSILVGYNSEEYLSKFESMPNWYQMPFEDFMCEVATPHCPDEYLEEVDGEFKIPRDKAIWLHQLLRIFREGEYICISLFQGVEGKEKMIYLITIRFKPNAINVSDCEVVQFPDYGKRLSGSADAKDLARNCWFCGLEILEVLQGFERTVNDDPRKSFALRKLNPLIKETYVTYILDKTKPIGKPRGEFLGGTHASPKEHIRMGHKRTYSSGKEVWVKETIVNEGSPRGKVNKDYKF